MPTTDRSLRRALAGCRSGAGRRAVALDKHTVQILREHRRRQLAHRARRLAAHETWEDSGYVFVRSDGKPINPNYATTRFRVLTNRPTCHRFRIHEGRTLSGLLRWGTEGSYFAASQRNLVGRYQGMWRDYSNAGGKNGTFRWLAAAVEQRVEPVSPAV